MVDINELNKYEGKLAEAYVYHVDGHYLSGAPIKTAYREEGFVHDGIFYCIAFPSLTHDGYGAELLPRRAHNLQEIKDSRYPNDIRRRVMEAFIERGETKVELSLPVSLPIFDSLSKEIRENLRKK